MTVQFVCRIDGAPHNVSNKEFRVAAEECALVGTWYAGRPWRPDTAQFRAALPYRWRAAFDRGSMFWRTSDTDECHTCLYNTRGKPLATVRCKLVTC